MPQVVPKILAPAHRRIKSLGVCKGEHPLDTGVMILGGGEGILCLVGKAKMKRLLQILRCFEDVCLEGGQILIVLRPQGELDFRL